VFYGVLEEMARHFARIDVISPRPGGAITTRELFGNVHLHPSERSRVFQVKHILATARRLMAERRYALITSHDYGLFYNGIAAYRLHRAMGVPYLSEIHHVPGHPRPASLRERIDLPLNWIYARFAARHAAAIRVVNRVEMPELLRSFGVPDEKIRVIPSLYLDTEVFRPRAVEKRHDVVICGRLVANKRFDLVVDAIKLLANRGRRVSLLMIGDGPLRQSLLEQAVSAGVRDQIVHEAFLPTAEDLAQAYCSARMLVCASTSEGGPRVTCEAMACGVPVITTPVGVMTELVKDGDNGLRFEWDSAALAAAIASLLDDPDRARRIGERGRAAVLPFERVKMIRNYAESLKQLAAGAG
jgi:glycosyltransferase involved in cell wall biosynthesis